MKKSLLFTSVVLLSLTLAACGNNNKETTNESTKESFETVETEASSVTQTEGEIAVFKGKISELPVIDEDTVPLTFDKVEAIEDPDKLVDSFNASGVVLLASLENLEGFEAEDLEVGTELQFELETPAATTFSIPPQIAGSSIKKITVVE